MYGWQVKTNSLIYFLILILAVSTAMASEKIVIGGLDGLDPRQSGESYSVLLALSGGGARGLTIIGVLKAFEEKNIRVDGIAGTSMGGIIGGLYATGYSPYQLDSIISKIDFSNLFSNSPPRRSMFLAQRQERDRHLISIRFKNLRPVIPKALTAGQQLTSLLTELTTKANYQCGSDFSKLPIPFKTICTDVVSGERVELDHGSIANAMRATMAFPLAFTGVEDNGRILMDGGMVTPIPVEISRSLSDSIDFVVAINTASKLLSKDELISPIDIANQVTSIMTADKLKSELAKADYIIEPDIDEFSTTDFKYKDSLIKLGYEKGIKGADEIITLLKLKKEKSLYRIRNIIFDDFSDTTGFNEMSGKTYLKKEIIARLKKITLEKNLFQLNGTLIVLGESGDTLDIEMVISGFRNFNFNEIVLEFSGNNIFDDITLAKQFITDDNQITSSSLFDGLKKITELYFNIGYDLVHVKNTEIDPKLNKISIEIDEAIVQKIDVDNNVRTKDWFVRSYFSLKKDQPYSTSVAARGIRNVYGTNLFDRVTVDAEPSKKGVIVKVSVEEKTYSQLRLGWHWDDEYESEEFLEYLDDNVAGIGLEYLIHARYSPNRQNYYLSMKTDRIFSTYLTSKILLYYNKLNRIMFAPDGEEAGIRDEIKSGFMVSLGQQIARLGAFTADLIIEEIEYTDSLFNGSKEINEFGLRIIDLKSTVENFNRTPFTETGNKHLFQIQFAGKYLGGDIEFTKFYTSHEMYLPIGDYLNYHPKISLGASRSGLPPTELFYLGGMHSFSGFRTYQLAGDKMFQFTNEFRFKFPYNFYLSLNYDLGEVYNHTDQIKLRNLRHGFGVTLALDALLGPIEVGYGIADKDFENFYINVGLKF